MSYTIWLLAQEQSTREYLTSVIADLARKYEGPIFEPHTTLLGDINLSFDKMHDNCESLAKQTKPFSVETSTVEYSTTYYQCLFVRLKPTPDLMTLYASAKQIFGFSNPSVFMPHISLYYGNVSFTTRHTIMQSCQLEPKHFTFDSLVITPGGENPPSAWKHVIELPFEHETKI